MIKKLITLLALVSACTFAIAEPDDVVDSTAAANAVNNKTQDDVTDNSKKSGDEIVDDNSTTSATAKAKATASVKFNDATVQEIVDHVKSGRCNCREQCGTTKLADGYFKAKAQWRGSTGTAKKAAHTRMQDYRVALTRISALEKRVNDQAALIRSNTQRNNDQDVSIRNLKAANADQEAKLSNHEDRIKSLEEGEKAFNESGYIEKMKVWPGQISELATSVSALFWWLLTLTIVVIVGFARRYIIRS